MEPKLNIAELEDYIDEVFPQVNGRFEVLELQPMHLRCRMTVSAADLRPGDTVSGPAMFTAADCAFYMVTLAMIGREALTVTTSCTINFMRKPAQAPIIADARILKLGRSLCVGDVLVYSEGMDDPVAQASMTYSIPPNRAV